MSRKPVDALRENAIYALAAATGTAAMAWLGLYGFAWTDYELEARAPLQALVEGHVTQFLRDVPVYGGSLVLRAPFALLADLWGGGALAVYRLVALPCLLAAAILGVWLVSEMRRRGSTPTARALVLMLCVANPLTLAALEVGHPEELLGGALCVAAVLLAARGEALWAGLVLGAAVANKEWALLALAPVLLALPARRTACLALLAATTAAVLGPLVLVHAGNFLAETRATAAPPSAIFQPWQLWWFLGHHGVHAPGSVGVAERTYRIAPAWVGSISHPLVLAVTIPLAAPLWLRAGTAHTEPRAGAYARVRRARAHTRTRAHTRARARRGRFLSEHDALLLLALLLLARCMLDTWDTTYYVVPFLLSLTAWEALGRRRIPAVALTATVLAWIDFEWMHTHTSADAQAALFAAWTLLLAAGLALVLYAPRALCALKSRGLVGPRAAAHGALTR